MKKVIRSWRGVLKVNKEQNEYFEKDGQNSKTHSFPCIHSSDLKTAKILNYFPIIYSAALGASSAAGGGIVSSFCALGAAAEPASGAGSASDDVQRVLSTS